jgi:hypothetical protein
MEHVPRLSASNGSSDIDRLAENVFVPFVCRVVSALLIVLSLVTTSGDFGFKNEGSPFINCDGDPNNIGSLGDNGKAKLLESSCCCGCSFPDVCCESIRASSVSLEGI